LQDERGEVVTLVDAGRARAEMPIGLAFCVVREPEVLDSPQNQPGSVHPDAVLIALAADDGEVRPGDSVQEYDVADDGLRERTSWPYHARRF